MIKLILVALILILATPNLTLGQAGYIGIYSDEFFTDCHVHDYLTALQTVYVVHQVAPGVTASQFMVEASAGVTMVYLAETSNVPITVGDSQAGVCLFYGGCFPSTILLMSITYFGTGTSAVCSELRVVPYPGLSAIVAVDCSENVWQIGGGLLYVNSDGSCDCHINRESETGESKPLTGITVPICSVPVETQSWGQIKALYR